MKTTSVKTYGGLPVEAVTNDDPFGILAALEENFLKPQFITKLTRPVSLAELVRNDPVMGFMGEALADMHSRLHKRRSERTATKMIRAHFGRYLEKDETKMLEKQIEGLETVEDKMQAVVNLIDKIKDRRKWKAEQSAAQKLVHYAERIPARKELVDGKHKWNDATVHDLPPLTGKGKAHEPAFYAIKLPDGRIINLGQSDGEHGAVKCYYPSKAFQHIATRLGIEMRGGDTAILNHLLGAEMVEWTNERGEGCKDYKYLPAYTTVWQGVWIVYVGWRLNPKCHSSSYWLDGDQLTQRPIEGEQPLTVSQLDYCLLTGAAEEKLEDADAPEDDQPTDFLNDEEEYVLAGLQRDESDDPLPIDNPLLTAYAYDNDRFIEMRNGSAVWNDIEFQTMVAEAANSVTEMRKNIRAAVKAGIFADDSSEVLKMLKRADELEELVQDMDSQMNPCYGVQPPRWEFNMRGTERHLPAMEPVKDMACFHRVDSYQPPAQIVHHVDEKPPVRTTTMQRLKQGRTAAILTKNGWTKRVVPKTKERPTSARNASPALTAVLRKMIRDEVLAS